MSRLKSIFAGSPCADVSQNSPTTAAKMDTKERMWGIRSQGGLGGGEKIILPCPANQGNFWDTTLTIKNAKISGNIFTKLKTERGCQKNKPGQATAHLVLRF